MTCSLVNVFFFFWEQPLITALIVIKVQTKILRDLMKVKLKLYRPQIATYNRDWNLRQKLENSAQTKWWRGELCRPNGAWHKFSQTENERINIFAECLRCRLGRPDKTFFFKSTCDRQKLLVPENVMGTPRRESYIQGLQLVPECWTLKFHYLIVLNQQISFVLADFVEFSTFTLPVENF